MGSHGSQKQQSQINLIDSHCHLDRLDLEEFDGSLDKALATANAHGVTDFLNVSISLDNWQQVIKAAEQHPCVYASVGIHPNEAAKLSQDKNITIDDLTSRATHEKVVAIGETGLDYFHTKPEYQEKQQQLFRTHIAAAKESNKPLIIHTREAKQDTLKIMQEEQAGEIGGVLHCFTEDLEMAQQALDMGFYISFSGIITFKSAESLREVAKQIPADRFLIETDSPYLAPAPYRGKPNHPTFVRLVAEELAKVRGVELAQIAQESSDNFNRLFLSKAQS